MLTVLLGGADRLIAETTSAPGAEMSGFGTPVAVGPALENQHTSPSTMSRVRSAAEVSIGSPPAGSRRGTRSPISVLPMLVHRARLTVQPTPMIDGFVAGKLIVPSRTPLEKMAGFDDSIEASPKLCK